MSIFEFSFFGITIAPTWYGLAYAMGFLFGYSILKRRGKFSEKSLDSLLVFIFLGVILGGRLGYVLFYNLPYFLANPSEILATWRWGMSFHGWLLGVILAMFFFARKEKLPYYLVADELALILPIGLFFGRIANYINGELFGFAPYSWPFAIMVGGIAHFPSPLLEALLEGIVLGWILYFASKRTQLISKDARILPNDMRGFLSWIFLFGYAIMRIIAEQFRLPDAQIGYIFGHVSLGVILSIPMILFGMFLILRSYGFFPSTKST